MRERLYPATSPYLDGGERGDEKTTAFDKGKTTNSEVLWAEGGGRVPLTHFLSKDRSSNEQGKRRGDNRASFEKRRGIKNKNHSEKKEET